MTNSIHRSHATFIEQADDLLRRADDRLIAHPDAFHAATIQELASCFDLAQVSVFRTLDDDAKLIASAGTESLDQPEVSILQTATTTEVHRTQHAGRRLWLCCESIDELAAITVSVIVPEALASVEFEEVLSSLARMHADAERRNRLQQVNSLLSRQNKLLNLIAQLHTSRTETEAANIFATDGATLMGVDRVSVVMLDDDQPRLVAATGVADPQHRANATRAVEALAKELAANNTNLPWIEAAESTGTTAALSRGSGSTAVRALSVGQDPTRAIVVLEQFQTPVHPNDVASGLALQFETALANIDAHGGSFKHRLSKLRRQIFGGGRWLILAGVVVAALCFIPARFKVEAYGVLQPKKRQDIFAPEAGRVVRVLAEDSTEVDRNAVLLELTDTEIDLAYERIKGELSTASSQLAAVTASRGIDRQTGLSATATAEELRRRIESLERQLALASTRRDSLSIQSPVSGVVFHGDLSRTLVGRPVQKGQFLLQVADPRAYWEVQLQIPDDMIRHVLAANQEDPADVSFMLRMSPDQTYKAELDWVGLATNLDQTGQLTTPARIELGDDILPIKDRLSLRPGSGVIAEIDCGTRSLGYVWFHRAIDFLQRRLF